MSKVKDLHMNMTNYADFKSAVKRFGLSINNFYDVHFQISSGSPLYRQLIKNPNTTPEDSTWSSKELMRLYTDEAILPGLQMSTGEYRVNNTPTLKYAYGSVFSEAVFNFVLDADSVIKSVFDIWTQWIYSYSNNTNVDEFIPSTPTFRTKYKDDYTVDIVIVKYERSGGSIRNRGGGRESFRVRDIIPDAKKGKLRSKFYKAIPVYAVRLFNAFPSNVSSVALNTQTSEVNNLSVTFEYDTMTTTALNDGFISQGIQDPLLGAANDTSKRDAIIDLKITYPDLSSIDLSNIFN